MITFWPSEVITFRVLSFMLSFGVIIYFMLSFNVIIFDVIIWCYHFSQFANVIIFVLPFFLVQHGCYHLCYHLMLSFFVIISPLFSFSWKRDTLLQNSHFCLHKGLEITAKKIISLPEGQRRRHSQLFSKIYVLTQ